MKIGANRLSRTVDHKKYSHVGADRIRASGAMRKRSGVGARGLGPPEFCRGKGPPVKVAAPTDASASVDGSDAIISIGRVCRRT